MQLVTRFQREHLIAAVALGSAALLWSWPRLPLYPVSAQAPIRPLGIQSASVRAGLEQRLMRISGGEETVLADLDLGNLEPKGRTTPDGSEVWGYPKGSGLEDLIEVHVKEGRVVREVLRPSSRFSAKELTGS